MWRAVQIANWTVYGRLLWRVHLYSGLGKLCLVWYWLTSGAAATVWHGPVHQCTVTVTVVLCVKWNCMSPQMGRSRPDYTNMHPCNRLTLLTCAIYIIQYTCTDLPRKTFLSWRPEFPDVKHCIVLQPLSSLMARWLIPADKWFDQLTRAPIRHNRRLCSRNVSAHSRVEILSRLENSV